MPTVLEKEAPDYSGVDPVARDFLLSQAGALPLYTLPVREAREVLEAAQSGAVRRLPAEVDDRTLPVGPKGTVPIRIVRPAGSSGPLPVVVYFHGGGWVLGSENTHDRLIREIANGANAAVVFVNYTPSPEGQYPLPVDEAYAATKWIAENGAAIGLDGTRLAVAGDSAGGNMAAVVALIAAERRKPAIRFQALLYPVTDANFDTESYREFAEGYYLTREMMQWFWDSYAPDVADRSDPKVAPLRASAEQLRGLPPALVITNEFDVLRDEGEAYAHKLINAGVDVTAIRLLGSIHDAAMLNSLRDTPAARDAISQTHQALYKALH